MNGSHCAQIEGISRHLPRGTGENLENVSQEADCLDQVSKLASPELKWAVLPADGTTHSVHVLLGLSNPLHMSFGCLTDGSTVQPQWLAPPLSCWATWGQCNKVGHRHWDHYSALLYVCSVISASPRMSCHWRPSWRWTTWRTRELVTWRIQYGALHTRSWNAVRRWSSGNDVTAFSSL